MRYVHHFVVMALLATAVYYYLYAEGTALLLSSVAGLLSGVIPLFTFGCAFLFLREEKLNARMTLGVLLGFVGVLLIARPWAGGDSAISLQGVIDMMLGSLSIGCSFVYAKRFLTGLNISAVALCTYQIGLALVMLLAVTDRTGMAHITESPKALIGLALGLGLSGTGVAYILYYFIVERLGAVVAASATYIPPIVALLIGIFVAGEPVHGLDLVAIAAILGGVLVLQSGRRMAAQQASAKDAVADA
ncbi:MULTISPECIES: DMT family transporter [unclassified Pseudomonas]|uniref:DMT family transporter n=1 Tax=unclassified Pseudomonas TaxID=196821 RepID=UPI0025D1A892|nr:MULTISPECIES: DMT family transporter [unclassified Pseudomonas]